MRRKVAAFTLLEVVVCVALLAIMASAFAWKGNNLLQHHLLRNSANTIVREVEAAHLLALSYQTDVALKLVEKKGEFFLEWQTDEPILLSRCRSRKMRGVKNVHVDYKKSTNVIIADFTSGRASSCKVIDFADKKGHGCRIELRQGKPLNIHTLQLQEE